MSDKQEKWEDCGECLKCGNIIVGKSEAMKGAQTPKEEPKKVDIRKELSKEEVMKLNNDLKEALDEMDPEEESDSDDESDISLDEEYETLPMKDIVNLHGLTPFTDSYKLFPYYIFKGKSRKRLCTEIVSRSNSNIVFMMDNMSRFARTAANCLKDLKLMLNFLASSMAQQLLYVSRFENGTQSDMFIETVERMRCFFRMAKRVQMMAREAELVANFFEKKCCEENQYEILEDYRKSKYPRPDK